MSTRAQRRDNREKLEATAKQEAFVAGLPAEAEKTLGMRRDFVAEAIESGGIVSLTFRPHGTAKQLEVYGGAISVENGSTGLRGDTVVNTWKLPELKGFRVNFDKDTASVDPLQPDFGGIDVSNIWLRTSDQLTEPQVSIDELGNEQNIVVTREGLAVLVQTMGGTAIAESLQQVEAQMFDAQANNL